MKMDTKRQDNENAEGDFSHEGYYDNPPYLSNFFWHGPGVRYPSRYRSPYVNERGRVSEESSASEVSSNPRRRKLIIASIAAAVILVIVGVIGAVFSATFTQSDKEMGSKTVERIVKKGYEGQVTLTSKTWTDSLNDKNSTEYKTTEAEFIQKMDAKFSQGEFAEKYGYTMVTGFKQGSVQVSFVVVFQVVMIVEIGNVDTPSTTTADGLINSGVDIGVEINTVMGVFEDDSEFEDPTVSDMNECDSNPCSNGGTCTNDVGQFICTCLPGYTGETCNEDINECDSNPCQNGGICADQVNRYTCSCVEGTQGLNCEINIDECDSNPCQNDGTCEDQINSYTCTCKPGFNGEHCGIDINECETNPCENGGTCFDAVNDYTCACNVGWTGKKCETNVDDCESNPCENGGTCKDAVNDYTCACFAGWTGKDCDTNINDCEDDPCENGGLCVDAVNSYNCFCEAGWTGKRCDTNIDDCKDDPCENGGTCLDGDNDYTCMCEAGWQGKNCAINIDECASNPCRNGGSCIDGINMYTCACQTGYTDTNCQTDIDDCDSDPCGNALACRDAVNDYMCICETGWTGKDCNINIDECASNPCRNGGNCIDGINMYSCTCQIGYTDTNCQIDIDDCGPDTCENARACIDAINDYMCICETGWTGKNCSINTNDCESEPCKNEGVCIDLVNDYKCTCQSGWEGKDCDLNVDDCINDNCDHGVCSDGVNDYSCSCDHGWEGQYCDQDVNECLDDPCENSVGCQNINGSFLCICSSGWAGSACDQNINECNLPVTLCKNEATCVDSVGSYRCVCVEGWEGKHCEIAITTTTKTSAISETTSTTTKGTSQGTTKSPCDTASEYECIAGNVSCISSEKLCDGQTDCDDNSDELLCPSKTTQASTSTTASTSTRNTTTTTNTTRKTTKSATSATLTTPPTSTTSTATTTTPFTCDADEVLCDIGTQCIPEYYLCDGDFDCSDGSDEADCPNPCRDDQLYCENTCYPGSWICDGYADCYGGSDEKGCDCPEGRCRNGDCYNFVGTCNGLKDCLDGTDEKDCPIVCLEDQFKCISLLHEKCVNVSQLCDGSRDCPDGSDEWYNCSETTTVTNPSEFEVRLMDGDNDTTELLYGRVEIRPLVNGEPLGEFGTICDDSWDSREASVLCKSLNASEVGPSYAYGSAAFGKGSGPIWFRNFHCEGDENRLEDCISSGFVHCSHQQDAAISCGVDRTTSTLSTSTAQTPAMSSTTTSPTKTTRAPTEGDPEVRLVGGDNCLEGRVEFFYKNEWATVCDDYFYSFAAIAVCKSLGFSTYDSYRLYFGPGTGAHYHLYCNYGDESIWDCNIGYAYCYHTEDVGVRCAGDPDVLCKINPGVPSVNCTFNQDICAYNRTKISGNVDWGWKEGSSVFMTDAYNIVNGKVMLYENMEGSETDGARIESPVFSPSAGSMIVEFYYQLHQSSFKNLIFSVGETMEGVGYEMKELWSSDYLPRDLEYKWLYQCVSLTDLNLSSNYSLMFTAMRGPIANTVAAVDSIHVREGHCPESLLDGMCTFDQLSVCGLTVECSTCDRTIWDYKWIWKNSTENGHYMLADSSFGSEGDESVMSFSVPNLGTKTVLYFWYYMTGENRGTLEVHLFEGDTFHSNLVRLNGDNGSTTWALQCLMLPSDIDRTAEIKIKFTAVNGKSGTADIGVDDVTLDTGECPHGMSCMEDIPQCGWITNANKLLSWTFNEESSGSIYTDIIRLVNGYSSKSGFVEIFHDGEWGRVCDNSFGLNDAKVVCRMLGYPTDYVDYDYYQNIERGMRVWLDNLRCTGVEETLEDCQYSGWGIEDCAYFEHIYVYCSGEASVGFRSFEKNFFSLHDANPTLGSWALVSSRAFEHHAGNYRFMFEYGKSEGVILQVWYHSFTENQTHILDKIIDETDMEQFCVDLPQDLNGKISLGITAFRMSSDIIKSAVKDLKLVQGPCREYVYAFSESCLNIEVNPKPYKYGDSAKPAMQETTREHTIHILKKGYFKYVYILPPTMTDTLHESLATLAYTFESEYHMTGYDVTPLSVEGNCESWHGWTRVLASTNKHMDKDHTLQDETGHYMYADGRSSFSALQLETVSEEESQKFCSLQFYYFTSGESRAVQIRWQCLVSHARDENRTCHPYYQKGYFSYVYILSFTADYLHDLTFTYYHKSKPHDGGLFVNVNDIQQELTGIPKVNAWFPSCVTLVDTCGNPPGRLNITFETLGMEAGLDDIMLSTEPCKETEAASISCRFWGGHTCGYYMDSSAWNRSSGGLLITAATTPGRFLVSPPFDVVTNSCISITFNGSSEYAVEMTVIDNTGETVAASGLKKVKNPKDEEMYLNVKPGTGLRLYFDAYYTTYSYLERNGLAVYFVNISEPSCSCSGLSCVEDKDSNDGKYESSVNCTFNTANWACGYQLFHARKSNVVDYWLEMYAEFAYIVSPEVSVSTNSCLVIYLGPCYPSNIRISTDDGEMYTPLFHGFTGNGYQTVNVDVITGSYTGLVIETQPYVPFEYNRASLTKITLLDQPCLSQMTQTTSLTSSSQTVSTSSRQTSGTTQSGITGSTDNSKTTTAPVQLQDDFPKVVVEPVGILEYGDSVTLSCRITYSTYFELILHWMKGSKFTISRGDDVLPRDGTKSKYLVTMSQDIGEVVYNLTINDISEDDIDYFSCVVDVLGYTAKYWPSDGTKIQIKEDGCIGIHNTEIGRFCPSFGYNRITVPTLSGLQTLTQVNQAVLTLQHFLDNEGRYWDFEKGCLSGLNSLACGLLVNHCKAGKIVRPTCREHCQDMISLCGFSVLNLEYFCKYLPTVEDDPECQVLWLECGTSIKLDNHNGTNGSAVRLRSENYPYGSPSSPRCKYVVYGSKYYNVSVTLSDLVLADECFNSYLEVNGEKICSDNTSKLEQLVDGEVVSITLFANASDTATGFLMTFSQALPTGMCDVIEINSFSHQQYDGYITKTPSCSEWLFYTKVYTMELKFTSLVGCVELLDEDSRHIQKICDLETEPDLSIYYAIKIISSDGFRLNYTLLSYIIQDFTIESIELRGGASDNEGKVFITRTDGNRGYLCGYIGSDEAEVICRAAGFAYAESVKSFNEEINEEDVILYHLYCVGNEDSLMQCYFQEWKDTCTDYCRCNRYYNTRGVSCALKSLTCYRFLNETRSCGYEFDSSKVLPVFTLRFGDGLYTTGSENHITNISSPDFTYLRGGSISFDYSFDGNPDDSLELYLKTVDGSGITSLWKKPEFTIDGRFTACVQLPDIYIQKPVQVVFKMTLMSSVADKDHAIGLHLVEQKHESCKDIFPKGVCSFDNVDDCSEIFSQICYFSSAETSIWQIENNMLIGDSSYASPDKEYPIAFSALKTAGSYLHFKYSQTGSGVRGNDLKLQVRSESDSDGLQTVYSISENKLDFINICTRLPSTKDDSFNISFILTKSSSEGIIFLDDISVSDVSCPNPISCDFEVDNCAFVVSSNAGFFWERTIGNYTSGDFRDGYVMQALHNNSTRHIEQRAEFQTPVAYLSGDAQYKCLSFLYKTNFSIDAYYKLEVEVFYLDTNEKVISEVHVFIPYMWQKENIEVDPSKSTKAQFSFLLTRFSGQVSMPVAVDDVTLLQTNCIGGLQDMKECNFSNPGFCSFERNCTTGSAYMWKVQSGYTSTRTTGPSADADGNTQGHYIYMDSSLGATGHESYLWFNVDLTNSTSQQYQFFYHMSGDGTAKFETFYRDATTNTYSQKSTIGNITSNMWHLSNCYQLPSNFKGEIYFKAVRGDSDYSDIALDNVKVMDESCKGPSVSCDFSSSSCGYIPNKGEWTLKGGYITAVETGELDVPIYTLTEEACIQFEFEGFVNDVLTLKVDKGFEHEEIRYIVYTDGTNLGQITYHPTYKRMKLLNTIHNVVMVGRVEVASGGCKELTCSTNEKASTIQCIPSSLFCDGTWDSADGRDERDCGFNITCEFSESMCGYGTVSGSPTNWTVSDSHTFYYKDIERTVSGGMLLTSYKDVSTSQKTSFSSKWQTITETSCLRFSYLGTVPSLTVTVSNKDNGTNVQWMDLYADMTPTSWRPAQMTVEAGTIMVTFTASLVTTNYTINTARDAFVAVDKIEILSAACDMLDPPDCPDDAGSQCDNGSLCYNEEVKCDRKQYCLSGLDESPSVCDTVFIIPCDFEQPSMCGWTIQTISGTPWNLSTGYKYQIPPYDHTKNDVTGHFLHSVNEEGENFHYERSSVMSPTQIFKEDGCITFWYYLNSTDTQPSALSAQILVSLFYLDSNRREFLWYDYVDRPIDTWIQGGVPVHANQSVQMNVTSIHFETYSAWPGVVALDDVEYTAGKCLLKQECHMRSFECKDSGVCIPEEFICNGKVDCEDKSDEAMCKDGSYVADGLKNYNTDRPDGTLSLAGGDGSYGQLRYYQHSSWYAVCHSGSKEKAFYMAHWACNQLGYGGNADVFEYQYVDNDMQAVLLECNLTSCRVSNCYTYYSTTFAGIMCSNSACFSGQKRCRGTDSVVCLAKERFCDGLPDCPDNSDEEECYCKAGENHCTRTLDECIEDICQTCADKDMFECQNHQCIDKTKRCDGKKDCSDGLDEYRCVQVNANQVLVHNGSELLNVCYNNIGLDEADILCSLSGKGMVTTEGIGHGHTPVTNGVILSETDDAGTLLPGLQISQKKECYPLELECKLPECGTTVYMDRAISPLVVHGDKAVPGEWPHQGYLTIYDDFNCGCTLLGDRWVLTAAHCVKYESLSSISVFLGSNFVGDKSPYVQKISVTGASIHPSYDKDNVTKGNDLAILQLAYAPNIDADTRPVCLGREGSWKEILDQGEEAECYITGFGITEMYLATGEDDELEYLRKTRVHIVDRNTCEQRYEGIDITIAVDDICVENRKPYAPACYGDSGGPLVCKNKAGRWEQFGVTSYGSRYCKSLAPSVYVGVTSNVDWFKSITGLNFGNTEENVP